MSLGAAHQRFALSGVGKNEKECRRTSAPTILAKKHKAALGAALRESITALQASLATSSGRIGKLMVMSAPLPGVERISTSPPKKVARSRRPRRP